MDHRVLFNVVVHLVKKFVEELHELCLRIDIRCDMVEGGSLSLFADFGFRKQTCGIEPSPPSLLLTQAEEVLDVTECLVAYLLQ